MENRKPSEDGRTGVDNGEINSAVNLSEHADKPFEGEALRAAMAKIGHTPFVDTEQLSGNDSGEVVYESQDLVGELLAERGDWRFDDIARHAGNLR
ncbi:MAG TPA: hypothetical protein VJW73_03970 [Gemmatimonadaceae bacterium]|nr:hypothetical protein [Gemmatimonadaceae bacterium]